MKGDLFLELAFALALIILFFFFFFFLLKITRRNKKRKKIIIIRRRGRRKKRTVLRRFQGQRGSKAVCSPWAHREEACLRGVFLQKDHWDADSSVLG